LKHIKVIKEGAFTVSDAKKQGLALAQFESSYVLYDMDGIRKSIRRQEASKPDMDYPPSILTIDDLSDYIVGYMSVEPATEGYTHNAAIVQKVVANKGWGPLLYDIVMSDQGGLIPDRKQVSKFARPVWQYYHDQRDDVDMLKLDDENDPRTPPTIDDVEELWGDYDSDNPLDYAYFLKKKVPVTMLKANHKVFLKQQATSANVHKDDVEAILWEAGESKFNSRKDF